MKPETKYEDSRKIWERRQVRRLPTLIGYGYIPAVVIAASWLTVQVIRDTTWSQAFMMLLYLAVLGGIARLVIFITLKLRQLDRDPISVTGLILFNFVSAALLGTIWWIAR